MCSKTYVDSVNTNVSAVRESKIDEVQNDKQWRVLFRSKWKEAVPGDGAVMSRNTSY